MPQGQLVALARRTKLGDDGNLMQAAGTLLNNQETKQPRRQNFVPSLLCCSTIPHSLPRRSNSPRRNAVKTGAKTGALRTGTALFLNSFWDGRLGHLAFEFNTEMATTIRAVAVTWFISRFGIKSKGMYASKFYIPEESWTHRSAWGLEIPQRAIEKPKSAEIHLLCQTAPDTKDFYHLKVPVQFLKKEKRRLYVRKNGKVSLFLSAERGEMFVDQRGSGKVSFARFLKPTNLAA